MDPTDRFIVLVDSLCTYSGMYVNGDEQFYGVCSYLYRYAYGAPDSPISGERYRAFSNLVCATFRFPDKYVWSYVIRTCSRDD
jgi:hypothetical protein